MRSWPIGGYVLLLLSAFESGAGSQAPQPFKVSVNVDLVVLNTTVRDSTGQFASGLEQRDFEVYEDGVRQSVSLFLHEDIPVTVGLVVDHSSSMRHKLLEVIAASRTFVEASSPEDQIFVVNFNEKVTLGLSDAVRFTDRPAELGQAILRSPAGGMTALYDAVIGAEERLKAGTRDKKVLIVISDGGDNASKHSLADAVIAAERSNALVYTVGIFDPDDEDKNPGVLRQLAKVTGGEAYFPEELSEVVAICGRIAGDIRHQYTLGYSSNQATKPGVFRSIRVVARSQGRGKLTVRARSGYEVAK